MVLTQNVIYPQMRPDLLISSKFPFFSPPVEQNVLESTWEQVILDLSTCNGMGLEQDLVVKDPVGSRDCDLIGFQI